jgi:hypothetical protein
MIKSGEYFEYQGCVHVHTTDSDGTKTVEEIAEIASSINLDFVLVTDHMTLKSRFENKEGYYDRTLLLVGYEHNDQEDCNHYLLFGCNDVLPAGMKPADYVAEGKRQGALGIIAHPDEIRPRLGRFPSYPWLAWDAEGFDGIEIWNQMSEWMEKLTSYNQIKMVFSPRRFMQVPTDRILQKWDDLNMTRPVAGVAAVDAHAFLYRLGPLKITIFPYKVQFKSLRTHVLLPQELSRDLNTARAQLYDAIRDCRVFISNHRWGDASGFQFMASRGTDSVIAGGRLGSCDGSTITLRSPGRGIIRLICNGHKVIEAETDYLEFNPEKNGVYRAELYKKDRGWIFSNHVRIGA